MHVVTSGHVTKMAVSGHNIRSVIAENPMLHANLTAMCFIEPELLPIEVFTAGVGFSIIVDLLCSRDLDLDPMTFIYELDPITSRCT